MLSSTEIVELPQANSNRVDKQCEMCIACGKEYGGLPWISSRPAFDQLSIVFAISKGLIKV